MNERFEQVAKQGNQMAQIAYHGLAAAIHRFRLESAGSVMERMDHKNALYIDLGNQALTGKRTETPVAGSKGPGYANPRTLAEMYVDRRMDKKAVKRQRRQNYAVRAKRDFGPDTSKELMSPRHAVIMKANSFLPGYEGSRFSLAKVIGQNVVRAAKGPDIKGKTKFTRKIDRTVNNYQYITGKKTAKERRAESIKIGATPNKLGDKAHRYTRKRLRRREEALERAVDQQKTTWWRNKRRERAIGRIITQKELIDKHREAIQKIKSGSA